MANFDVDEVGSPEPQRIREAHARSSGIPAPSSAGVLPAFLQRIRFSPGERIDRQWLVECLGISQSTNAGRTLDWLKATGLLNSGRLSVKSWQGAPR